MADWQERIDALYRLDPDEFVAARNDLAKEVRGEDRKAATVVRNLAKPTIVAWSLNQVAASDGALIDAVIAATGAVAAAQSDGKDMRAASQDRRAAIGALVDAAVSALAASGRNGESHRESIRNTVEAASLDPALAEALRAGRLEHELDAPAVFGAFDFTATAPAAARRPKRPKDPVDDEEREKEARRARAEAEDLAELAATARERAQDAALDLRRAREAVQAAEQTLATARRDLERAMDAAKQLSLRAAEVEREAEEAHRRADELAL